MDKVTRALPPVGVCLAQPGEGTGLFLIFVFNISRAVPLYKRDRKSVV